MHDQQITDDDYRLMLRVHGRRQEIVDEVRASTALEGGRACDAVHELQRRSVTGEITREQI